MTPYSPEPPAPQPPIPETAPQSPFWNYQDLLFFLSLCFPSLLVAVLIVRVLSAVTPMGKPFQGLLAQLIWYSLIFGSLYALLRLRYGQPFWRSLGWRVPVIGAAASFFAGPLLAVLIGLLGSVLRTPEITLPFQEMLRGRPTILLFAVFVVILGPLCEELAFRGFLLPLLVRSFGAAAGIILTGFLFGSLHAPEYGWHWQHVVLISTAGSVFGWVRFKTGSTAAAAFMHSTYNLTQFAAFLAQNRTV
jgi:membrane protease YdiL (CAAX protease family)